MSNPTSLRALPRRPDRPVIRRVWPFEFSSWREHLKRLDPQTRRARFFGPVRDEFIDSYVDKAHARGAIVYGAFVGGCMRAAGELQFTPDAWLPTAEAAFSVETGWQDEGIGSMLLSRVILAARNRGVTSITMHCQLDNARMRRVAAKYGAELKFEEGSITGRLLQPWPDAVSWLEESFNETQGVLAAVFRWPPQPPQTSLTR
ncbi:MAG: GNAT family N-acetyltransferase [Parvibaculaceae bacterium]